MVKRSAAVVLLCAALAAAGCRSEEEEARTNDLVRLLRDDDVDIRREAAELAMRMGPGASAAVPALIENLGTGRGKRQLLNVAATNALLRIGPRAALPALVEALDNEDAEIAAGAAFTIGGFGRAAKSAVPALLRALERPEVRGSASAALDRIEEG